jgi:2-oxoacid:acceptor oxidoreductase delta subunit (pyruvate/2-ketoisovalerate family)
LTDKLLHAIFTEEEANIIAKGIKRTFWPTTIRRIRKRSRVSKDQLKKIIKDMKYTGKIIKFGPFCIMLAYLPGMFEMYFTANRDDPESLTKAGEAHYALIESGFHVEHMREDYPFLRVIPSSKPVEKIIEVDKSIAVKHEVLPFEVLKKYLSRQKVFAVHPCSCRSAAKFSGNPCKRTEENFCVTAGIVAKHILKEGIGKKVTLDELLEIMKKAEKKGLVHQSVNIKKTSLFICQCCPCCCGVLKPTVDLKDKSIVCGSNFVPQLDEEKCTFCKVCIKLCPMETISEKDQQTIKIDLDYCIGCGVCANICPNDAIKLEKVENKNIIKRHIGILRKKKRKN